MVKIGKKKAIAWFKNGKNQKMIKVGKISENMTSYRLKVNE